VTPTPTPRWPYDPLLAAAVRRLDTDAPSDGDVAELLHATRDSVRKYRVRGLPPLVADQWAIRLGLHPMVLWPAEYAAWIPEEPRARRARARAERRRRQRDRELAPLT
jgi:hypothetical protein